MLILYLLWNFCLKTAFLALKLAKKVILTHVIMKKGGIDYLVTIDPYDEGKNQLLGIHTIGLIRPILLFIQLLMSR